MVEEELQQQLKRWGNLMASRTAANEDGPSAGDHILNRVRDFAPGTREKAERELVGRDGEDRRRYMAHKAGVPKMTKVPAWACDPIPARNDADPPHDNPTRYIELMIPDELRWIDSAIATMLRSYPLRALILNIEFTTAGTHGMKAARVAAQYGGNITVRQYRYELQLAMVWMAGRRAA